MDMRLYPQDKVLLHKALTSDRFHLDVIPANHVRRLRLDFGAQVSGRALLALEECLKALFEVSGKHNFELEFIYELGSRIVPRLEALRNVVVPPQEAGARVKVTSKIYGSHSAQDVSDYFVIPFEEWKAKWKSIAKADSAAWRDSELSGSDDSEDSDHSDYSDFGNYGDYGFINNGNNSDGDVYSYCSDFEDDVAELEDQSNDIATVADVENPTHGVTDGDDQLKSVDISSKTPE
jgi:hypothetical protein